MECKTGVVVVVRFGNVGFWRYLILGVRRR